MNAHRPKPKQQTKQQTSGERGQRKTFAQGFTLVELMVVIVIISVMAGIVSLSVSSVQNRKFAEQHDQLIDTLKLLRLQSLDQQQVLGLKVVDASATSDAAYQVVTLGGGEESAGSSTNGFYIPPSTLTPQPVHQSKQQTQLANQPSWQPLEGHKTDLPTGMRLEIAPLEQHTDITNTAFLVSNAPKLIWYGNGEATPAKLTLYIEQKPVYESVYVDMLGRVSTDASEAGL